MKKFFICLSLLIFTAMATAMAAQADVLVVANKSVAQPTLSRLDIKEIFSGNKQYWNDKSKISVATLSEGATAETFFQSYLGMSTKQYNGLWSEKLYTGGRTSPHRFKNSKQLMEFISQTAGAIGFIDSNTPRNDVNVVEIK